jgi:hypothetical protein
VGRPRSAGAAALLTSGKPIVYPELLHAVEALRQIGRARPEEARGAVRAPADAVAWAPGQRRSS